LDTNIFLTKYAPGEKEHESSKRLIEATEAGKLRAITSTLTLVEIASTVRRSPAKFPSKTSPSDAAGAFVRRALSIGNLTYVTMGGDMSLGTGGSRARVPLAFSAALKAVKTLPLKTLDLVHIASAYVAVRILGEELDFFATLDERILTLRKEVKDFLECPAVTPSEIVHLETL
jgi:predicted nucleic acid-binding protein